METAVSERDPRWAHWYHRRIYRLGCDVSGCPCYELGNGWQAHQEYIDSPDRLPWWRRALRWF
jgi:hypothetical protein